MLQAGSSMLQAGSIMLQAGSSMLQVGSIILQAGSSMLQAGVGVGDYVRHSRQANRVRRTYTGAKTHARNGDAQQKTTDI